MGLLEIFFKTEQANGKFVSEQAYNKNRKKMVNITPLTLEQLRQMAIPSEMELKLEYIFYTNTAEKASQLANEIIKLGYTAEHGADPDKKKLFMITGRTTYMTTSNEVILPWTEQMCELGYKFDCEFDGWLVDTDKQ